MRHVFLSRLAVVTALCALSMVAALDAQDHADHAAMSADQIGSASVSFSTSCAPAVREDFNKAVALLHSFWFPEATRMFGAVAQADPACAMAHWGLAMSEWGNPFGGLRPPPVIDRGRAIVATARTTGTPTPRERALIEAVGILYSSSDAGTQGDRVVAYEAAMQAIADANPDDIELRIFAALAVTQAAPPTDKTYARQLRAAAVMEPLFATMPAHPGLAHYIIHAYDAPPLAEKALVAARRYASLAPVIPHALHMPSHTFTRVGSWQESIDTNRRSAEAARTAGEPGAEAHALDYQTYAFLQIAQDASAKAVVDRAEMLASAPGTNTFAVAAIPARYALERGDWAAAANLTPRPSPTPYTAGLTYFARAIGASRSGNPAAATEDIARLAQVRDTLETMRDAYWTEQVDIQRRVALAWQTFAQGQREQGIAQLRAAADAEDDTEKAAVTPGPLAPARELLGDMLLEAAQPREALVAFEETLRKEPNRFRATYGAARAADAAGDRAAAAVHYGRLLDIAKDADTARPELVAARAFTRR